jgi:CRP/FNR family transcriptional regulator
MQDIRRIPLFSKLSNEEIQKLEDISSTKEYNSKEILFFEGEEPTYLYILLQGTLKLYKTNYKGNQIFLHDFKPINLVAELANFEDIPYPATAEFTSSGKVMKINYRKLEENFFKNPGISANIIKSLASKLKIMSEVVTNEVVLSAEAKVAKFLCENEELFNELKNTQISSILNITPETISRVLTKFKNDAFIRIEENHHVFILDKNALEALYM